MEENLMLQRIKEDSTTCKRMFDVPDLCAYLNMGRTRAVEYAKQIGAERRFGRRCLYDRIIIDKALDELTE